MLFVWSAYWNNFKILYLTNILRPQMQLNWFFPAWITCTYILRESACFQQPLNFIAIKCQARRGIWCNNDLAKENNKRTPNQLKVFVHNWNCEIHLDHKQKLLKLSKWFFMPFCWTLTTTLKQGTLIWSSLLYSYSYLMPWL